MVRINQKVRHHFDGVRGKVGQFRELAETLDSMFDSFHRMNRLSKDMFGNVLNQQNPLDRDRRHRDEER